MDRLHETAPVTAGRSFRVADTVLRRGLVLVCPGTIFRANISLPGNDMFLFVLVASGLLYTYAVLLSCSKGQIVERKWENPTTLSNPEADFPVSSIFSFPAFGDDFPKPGADHPGSSKGNRTDIRPVHIDP